MAFAQRLFSTRGGTLAVAGAAALLAIIAVVVYVKHYRSSVNSSGQPATVLVSTRLIPKGTPGSVIAENRLYDATGIRVSDVRTGALTDPSALAGQVAAIDIYPGQQLTAADFVASGGTPASQLAANERAITLPFDASHGLAGLLRAGDRVDIYAGFSVTPVNANGQSTGRGSTPILRLIAGDIPVMAVTGTGTGNNANSGSEVTFRTTAVQASNLAFAQDNGKLWLVLRPSYGAKASPRNIVDVNTLLLGVPSLQVQKQLGAK